MASFTDTAADSAEWFLKNPSDMSMKELKLALRNSGLSGEAVGFSEKHEFVTLLASHKEKVQDQPDCPVCFRALNFGMQSILLPCSHLLCEHCFISIVTRDAVPRNTPLSCTCPLCRSPLPSSALAEGMRGAQLAASALHEGWRSPAQREAMLAQGEDHMRESLRLEPGHVGILTTLADIALDRGDVKEAGTLCRRAIFYEPDNWHGYATLASVHKETDDLMAALHCYKKALSLEEDPGVVSNLANLHFALGDLPSAVAQHKRAVELAPSNCIIVFNCGVTLEEGDVDIDEAIRMYELAMELDAAGSPVSPPGFMRDAIEDALVAARAKKA